MKTQINFNPPDFAEPWPSPQNDKTIRELKECLRMVIEAGATMPLKTDLDDDISESVFALHDGGTGTEQECTVILGLLAQWHRQLQAAGLVDRANYVLSLFRHVYIRTRHFRVAAHRFLQSLPE